jgi:hypothetical protein
MPDEVNFSYWFHKFAGFNHRPTQIPNTILLRYEIKSLEIVMLIEQIALCQWGFEKVRVFGTRPPMIVRDIKAFVWPNNIFPYDFRINGPHPMIGYLEWKKMQEGDWKPEESEEVKPRLYPAPVNESIVPPVKKAGDNKMLARKLF